jgi:hypothetical protein
MHPFLLLQVLNFVAGGRDVSASVSLICQAIIRGPAVPLVKKLAYDVVHAAPLSDTDWALVVEGIRSDMMGTFSMEVPPPTSLGGVLQPSISCHPACCVHLGRASWWSHQMHK